MIFRLVVTVFASSFCLLGYSQSVMNERVARSFATIAQTDVTLNHAEQRSDGILISTGGSVVIHGVAYSAIAASPYFGYFFSVQGDGVGSLTVEILVPELGWRIVTTDEHVPVKVGLWQSALFSVNESHAPIELRLSSATGQVQVVGIDFSFITHRVDDEQIAPLGGEPVNLENELRGGGCSCPLPTYFTRTQYGVPNGGAQTCFPFISASPVTHLIVHHEGGGASQTSSNWAQRAFNIWSYHMNVSPENFCDVAYNWLLAPNGSLYEGRWGSAASNVRGAHMCGMHENKLGVCIMGDWTSGTPPAACFDKLDELLAWKACEFGIDPFADGPTTSHTGWMNNVSGHQDGCAPGYTVCPGNIQNQLGAIRNAVDQQMSSCGPCPQPANDGCSGSFTATLLSFGASCNPTSSTSCGATSSGFSSCAGTQDDDVFFRFVPTTTSGTITVTSSAGYNAVVQVLAGPCGGNMSELTCQNSTGTAGVETTLVTGLNAGTTYFVRVWHSGTGSGTSGDFTICAYGSTSEDITISGQQLSASSVEVGGSITASADHNYSGSQLDANLPSFDLAYFLSTNCSFGGGDVLLGSDVSGLGSDDPTNSESELLTIPLGTSPGLYFILFVADYDNELAEGAGEGNNVQCVQVNVTSQPVGEDITVTNTSLSVGILPPSGELTVTCDHNYSGGQLDADLPSFDLGYLLSTDCVLDGGGPSA